MTRIKYIGPPLLLALVLLLLVIAPPVLAQGPDYQIERFTVAGGSGTVTGGSYSAGQTAGQADANPATLSGGNYAVWGGFWQVSCPAVITVTVAADSGAGSLRQGLADVCPGGDIKFAPSLSGQSITLTSAELVINKALTISGTVPITINGNSSYQVIWVQGSGVATLSNLSLINGAEDYGGAIYNEGKVTLLNSTVAHNQANSDGGAIYNDGGTMTIRNSTLAHNYAGGYGGVIQNNGGTLTVANSTFFGNVTDDTAGAINVDNGTLVMTNSTVYSNSGYTTIFSYNSQLTLQNSVVYSNTNGGLELNSGSTLTMTNVIIGGTASSDDCVNAGTTAVNSNNLVEDGTCSAALSGDPKVTTFGNHGGDTDTLMLYPGSPAIEAGDAASCTDTDQRGKTRPIDGNLDSNAVCDIGPVEVYNLAPTAVDDPNESTTEQTALTISPLTNDTDPVDDDDDSLFVGIIGNPAHGAATISGTTQIVYTPTTTFNGTDTFTYTATDGGLSDTGTITVTVQSSNTAPVITDSTPISVIMSEDGDPTAFSLTLHASDPDSGDTLTWSIAMQPLSGTAWTVGVGSNSAIGYTPDANWYGTTVFTVAVSDGNLTDTVAVSVTVESVNDAPVITDTQPISVTMSEDGDPRPFDLTLHATDVDTSDVLTWSVVTQPVSGTATARGTGITQTVVYTPDTDWYGTTVFTVAVSDGTVSDTVAVSVTVESVNDAPVITDTQPISVTMSRDSSSLPFSLTLHASDPDSGDSLIWSIATQPLNGTATVGGTGITQTVVYTPDADWYGTEVLTVAVSDGSLTNTVTVSVTVVNGGGSTQLYLPLLLKDYATAPDLAITSLVADGGGITVTVKNQGNAPVSDGFWLDVYFNPARVPVQNEEWENVGSEAGAVWGVTAPIPAGGSLTLTVGDDYYDPSQSSGSFPANATVYGYVDSIHWATSYGAVYESNEGNNLYGPVISSAGNGAALLNGQGDGPAPGNLPPRN